MDIEKYKRIAYGEWFEFVDIVPARRAYERNVKRCLEAIEHHNRKSRPLEILAVHGSSRSSYNSCARELSNSQLFMRKGLEPFRDDPEVSITEARLRDYAIEPCNGCYSTTSALCGWPCDCFPFDPMQDLYPMVLRCDVLLCSTGVNQSAMSTRLKTFVDRLISMDGGFARDRLRPKDGEFRGTAIALSRRLEAEGRMPYDARMYGRVAAYFISSKDQDNTMQDRLTAKERRPMNYIETVAWSLREGFTDYGFWHADPWYAGIAGKPDREMSHDKEDMNKMTGAHRRAQVVVRAAVAQARKLRKHTPKFDGGSRKNRT